jgi:hypothetical protein
LSRLTLAPLQFVDHDAGFEVTKKSLGFDVSVLYWTSTFGRNAPRWVLVIATETMMKPPYVTLENQPDS